jgi:hypothetical protein
VQRLRLSMLIRWARNELILLRTLFRWRSGMRSTYRGRGPGHDLT